MANKLSAFLKLTRIEHSLMVILAVVAAELIAGGLPGVFNFIYYLFPPILVNMGAFAINDYFDIEADKLNKRLDRPLVSGALSKESAYTAAIACFLIGTALSFLINLYAFIIVAVFAFLSYLYSYSLKDTLLVGNVYVAFSMAIPFIYGNFLVSSNINPTIILISFVVFLSGLAREIHGTIRDAAGDAKARGSKNLVRFLGKDKAALFALLLYVEAIAISIFMFFYSAPFKLNLVYIVPVFIADLIFIYVAFGYLKRKDRKFFDLSRNLSLAAMGLVLLTYIFSAVFYL